jgi:hypothetical protein
MLDAPEGAYTPPPSYRRATTGEGENADYENIRAT